MDKEKVLNLAKLARIELDDAEAQSLTREFSAILDYVGEIKGTTMGSLDKTSKSGLANVFREDKDPHESGLYTKKILAQAPAKDGEHIKVKKIL